MLPPVQNEVTQLETAPGKWGWFEEVPTKLTIEDMYRVFVPVGSRVDSFRKLLMSKVYDMVPSITKTLT